MSGVEGLSNKLNMKIMYFSLLTVGTLAVVLTAVGAETAKKFEPKQLQEDFQIARRALEEGHPGLYRYTKKRELDRIFDEAENSLNHPMDFYEFYRVLALPIAAIKCGHTDVSLSPEVRKESESLPGLPFDVKVLDSRAYVFRDYAKGGALAGREIKSINGVPIGRIISKMLAAESQDGEVQTSREGSIGNNFALNLIVLLGFKAPYEVVLAECGTNQMQTVRLAGLTHEDRVTMSKQLFPQDHPKKDFATLKLLDDGQIAILTYASFGTTVDEGQAFMKHAFEDIQAKGSKALILDVRGNGGGDGELGALLFSYLVGAPFKYYDDLIINKNSETSYSFAKYTDPHRDLIVPKGLAELRADGKIHQIVDPQLSLQQPSKTAFTGPVYIVIDNGCFSTTSEFLTEVDVHHRAKFIGQESAGAYSGNNSGTVVRITLPNTKLGLYIPLMSGYMFVGSNHEHDSARGIIPEFPVQCTITDLLAGGDPAFELALKLARRSQ